MRKGGLATWSIRYPISTLMLTLAVVVLGFFALGRLSVDLLPHLIYPQVRVRVLDPGVATTILEDKITRQIEEQLAITEDAIAVDSETSEGNSTVNLHFEYGKDIDTALRDASTRLDRAKRFLPDTIDPPMIYKLDPSQIPVITYMVSSTLRDPVEMRTWVDDSFAKQFLNLPGVAAVEVGGGLVREIHVLPDQRRLAGLGLSVNDVIEAIKRGNEDAPGGRLRMTGQEYSSRTAGRVTSVAALAALPVRLPNGESLPLSEIANVSDAHEEERLRARFDGVRGIKMSLQKQPNANTVEVAEHVKARLAWLRANRLIPDDVLVSQVSDQSLYIRQSLNNASLAAISGAVLAMVVVYLFLGNLRSTLIIGTAIPISIMVTFVIMALGELTLNIMTLGGLALGVGMLVDNTIVMLENISRHKSAGSRFGRASARPEGASDMDVASHKSAGSRFGRASARPEGANHSDSPYDQGMALTAGDTPNEPTVSDWKSQQVDLSVRAAAEIQSAIVASTSTNLAAVLPFLFIGGLIGLLFRELIFTISAAILASLLVALTLVPTLAARMSGDARGRMHALVHRVVIRAQEKYGRWLEIILRRPWIVIITGTVLLAVASVPILFGSKQEFLPAMDDGRILINATTDPGMSLDAMDDSVRTLERLAWDNGAVEGVYSLIGGRIFGRTERETPNKSQIRMQLVPLADRDVSSQQWIKGFKQAVDEAQLAGVTVRVRTVGIRGLRTSRSDEDLSLRVQGPDLPQLSLIGDDIVRRLKSLPGLRNIGHSMEEVRQEFAIQVDRERAAELGIDVADIGRALRVALDGVVVSDFVEGGRSYDIRVRLPPREMASPEALGRILLFGELKNRPAVYLHNVANVEFVQSPAEVLRENQNRIVEITGALSGDRSLGEVVNAVHKALEDYVLPQGYSLYSGGAEKSLQEGRRLSGILLGLALFLVYVVMAVQYESLRNPTIIMLSVPFTLIGVTLGLWMTGLPLSMPVWLGLIMLAGIVVNNAIVLVEYIEILRSQGKPVHEAIVEAGRLRLRPILMTTLTTVVGMLPLALALGEGGEMLQPLAVTVVAGLSFSMLVSLVLVPAMYSLLRARGLGG